MGVYRSNTLTCSCNCTYKTASNDYFFNRFKFTKDQFAKGVSYYRQSVLLHSKISFMCPNPRTIFGKMQNQIANELVNENLWMVDKSSFDKCSVDRGKAKLLLRCQWEPGRLQYKDVIFQIYSGSVNGLQFVRGQEYYFIGKKQHIFYIKER